MIVFSGGGPVRPPVTPPVEPPAEFTGLNSSFTVETTGTSSTYPFMLGFVAEEGATDALAFDQANVNYTVKRTWADGSIKHAVITGRLALTQNVPLTVTVTDGTTAAGTVLTVANIRTAAPTATIDCGSYGSVTLSSLIASSPFDTPVANSEMVECRWRGQVGSDDSLVAWFQVRLFADGRMFVRAICENAYLLLGTGLPAADKFYTPTITINGSTAYTPAASTYTGSIASDTLTVSAIIGGPVRPGDLITGSGVTSNTRILQQYTGNAGDVGTYLVSPGQTVASTTITGTWGHHAHSSYKAEAWIGGDPATFARQDVEYLRANKFVPNYGWRNPGDTVLNAATQTYAPRVRGDLVRDFGDTGYSEQLGILPGWDARYCTSEDRRAYNSVLANAASLTCYRIVYREQATNKPIKLSSFPNWTNSGDGIGPLNYTTAIPNIWDRAHGVSAGYLAYMITGDIYYLDIMAFNSVASYLMAAFTTYVPAIGDGGQGTSRFLDEQARGWGWTMRTVGQYVALAPDGDAVAAECRTWMEYNISKYYDFGHTVGASQLGYPVVVNSYTYATGISTAAWMQSMIIMSLGHITDIGLDLSSDTKLLWLRDFCYKAIVGLLGGTGTSNYCYTNCTIYNIRLSNTPLGPDASYAFGFFLPDRFYATWGEVFSDTFDVDNTSCGDTLLDPDSSNSLSGAYGNYWGIHTSAIAYAVDHAATGADDSFGRLSGATNWSSIVASDFDNYPQMGIVPTGYSPRLPLWLTTAAPAVYDWVEIAGTKLGDVPGVSGLTNQLRLSAWGCVGVDRVTSTLKSPGNGGHGDYGGNEVIDITLSDDVPAWATIRGPSTVNANQNYFNDGRPNSTHTYFSVHYNPITNKVFRFGLPSRYSDSDGSNKQVDAFDYDLNDWGGIGAEPDAPGPPGAHVPGIQLAAMMCQDAVNFDVYAGIGFHIYKWTAATETWDSGSSGTTGSSDLGDYCSAVDTVRNRILLATRNGSSPQLYDIATQTFSSITFMGDTFTPASNWGLVYDIGLDRFLLKTDNPGPDVKSIHPTTWAVTNLTTGGSTPNRVEAPSGGHQSGVYGLWQYLPQLGGCVYLAGDSFNIQFLKTGEPL